MMRLGYDVLGEEYNLPHGEGRHCSAGYRRPLEQTRQLNPDQRTQRLNPLTDVSRLLYSRLDSQTLASDRSRDVS